ncbi:MAG TPA: cysteine hydrolase [Mycobacteriales bacterium]|nr:cysteine hydrolase [Mycobacteriales bacterium]
MEGTALLVQDVQTAIVEGAPPSMLRAVRVALDGAHAAGIPVIYIRVLLRPGRAGVSPRNKMLTRLHERLTDGAPGLEILPALAPLPDDFVLTKHRVSSFAGSGLDVLLRSLDVTHLVLTGVSTSTAVLATAMAAADLDFELTVLSDACFNGTEETELAQHRHLLGELLPRMAAVMTADEWVAMA